MNIILANSKASLRITNDLKHPLVRIKGEIAPLPFERVHILFVRKILSKPLTKKHYNASNILKIIEKSIHMYVIVELQQTVSYIERWHGTLGHFETPLNCSFCIDFESTSHQLYLKLKAF